MSNPIVYLDMDGVLIDLARSAFAFHGLEYPYDNPDNYGQWDFEEFIDMPQDEFWLAFDANFWANLEWTADGRDILTLLEDTVGRDNIYLASCPTSFTKGCAGCVSGKARWLNQHIPEYNHKFFFGAKKELLARNSDSILVDDANHNVAEFTKWGGSAFLVPRPWNSSHKESDDVLGKLEDFLLPYA